MLLRTTRPPASLNMEAAERRILPHGIGDQDYGPIVVGDSLAADLGEDLTEMEIG